LIEQLLAPTASASIQGSARSEHRILRKFKAPLARQAAVYAAAKGTR